MGGATTPTAIANAQAQANANATAASNQNQQLASAAKAGAQGTLQSQVVNPGAGLTDAQQKARGLDPLATQQQAMTDFQSSLAQAQVSALKTENPAGFIDQWARSNYGLQDYSKNYGIDSSLYSKNNPVGTLYLTPNSPTVTLKVDDVSKVVSNDLYKGISPALAQMYQAFGYVPPPAQPSLNNGSLKPTDMLKNVLSPDVYNSAYPSFPAIPNNVVKSPAQAIADLYAQSGVLKDSSGRIIYAPELQMVSSDLVKVVGQPDINYVNSLKTSLGAALQAQQTKVNELTSQHQSAVSAIQSANQNWNNYVSQNAIEQQRRQGEGGEISWYIADQHESQMHSLNSQAASLAQQLAQQQQTLGLLHTMQSNLNTYGSFLDSTLQTRTQRQNMENSVVGGGVVTPQSLGKSYGWHDLLPVNPSQSSKALSNNEGMIYGGMAGLKAISNPAGGFSFVPAGPNISSASFGWHNLSSKQLAGGSSDEMTALAQEASRASLGTDYNKMTGYKAIGNIKGGISFVPITAEPDIIKGSTPFGKFAQVSQEAKNNEANRVLLDVLGQYGTGYFVGNNRFIKTVDKGATPYQPLTTIPPTKAMQEQQSFKDYLHQYENQGASFDIFSNGNKIGTTSGARSYYDVLSAEHKNPGSNITVQAFNTQGERDFVSSLIGNARSYGADYITVGEQTKVRNGGVEVTKFHPLQSVPITEAGMMLPDIIKQNANKNNIVYGFTPNPENLMSRDTGKVTPQMLMTPDQRRGYFEIPLGFGIALPIPNALKEGVEELTNVFKSTAIVTTAGYASLPSYSISDIFSGKIKGGIVPDINQNPTPKNILDFVNENTSPTILESALGGRSLKNPTLAGEIGSGLGYAILLTTPWQKLNPLHIQSLAVGEGENALPLYKGLTYGFEGEPTTPLIGSSGGKIVLGTPSPELLPFEEIANSIPNRGLELATGSGLETKILLNDKALEAGMKAGVYSPEDVTIIKTLGRMAEIGQVTPEKIYAQSFGEQPFKNLEPGAQTDTQLKYFNFIQENYGIGPVKGSFAQIPQVEPEFARQARDFDIDLTNLQNSFGKGSFIAQENADVLQTVANPRQEFFPKQTDVVMSKLGEEFKIGQYLTEESPSVESSSLGKTAERVFGFEVPKGSVQVGGVDIVPEQFQFLRKIGAVTSLQTPETSGGLIEGETGIGPAAGRAKDIGDIFAMGISQANRLKANPATYQLGLEQETLAQSLKGFFPSVNIEGFFKNTVNEPVGFESPPPRGISESSMSISLKGSSLGSSLGLVIQPSTTSPLLPKKESMSISSIVKSEKSNSWQIPISSSKIQNKSPTSSSSFFKPSKSISDIFSSSKTSPFKPSYSSGKSIPQLPKYKLPFNSPSKMFSGSPFRSSSGSPFSPSKSPGYPFSPSLVKSPHFTPSPRSPRSPFSPSSFSPITPPVQPVLPQEYPFYKPKFGFGGIFPSWAREIKKSKPAYELTYESTSIDIKYLDSLTPFLKVSGSPDILQANDVVNRKAIRAFEQAHQTSFGNTLALFGSEPTYYRRNTPKRKKR